MNNLIKMRVYEDDTRIDTILINPKKDIRIVKNRRPLADEDLTAHISGDLARFLKDKVN